MLNPLAYLESPIGIVTLVLIGVCIVHAVRNGHIFPWIYIIIFLPAIGSLIYLVAVIAPQLFRSRGAAQMGAKARQLADPN